MARRKGTVMKHIHYLCMDAGLGREDRLDLAREILGYNYENLQSFSDLDVDDLEEIVHAIKSWQLIQKLRLANGSNLADAIRLVNDLDRSAAEISDEVQRDIAENG